MAMHPAKIEAAIAELLAAVESLDGRLKKVETAVKKKPAESTKKKD